MNEEEQAVTMEATLESLKAALSQLEAVDAAQREDYARRLLAHALTERDPELGLFVAHLMDKDPAIESALVDALKAAVNEQPDAVYSFARTRVAESAEKRWLPRLKLAALYSMRVAINDGGGCETIVNWLTLIAREPTSYELGDVLHYGILAAQESAHTDPDLARALILLAAKRDPSSLDPLLADQQLVNALPNNVGRVLRDLDGDPLALLQSKGVDIFLVSMGRAAAAGAGTMFTPGSIGKLWDLYSGLQPINSTLPPAYQPARIVEILTTRGADFLNAESLEMLATLTLHAQQDDLFMALLHQEGGAKMLVPRLIAILEHSERTINDAISLIGRLMLAGDIQPIQAAHLYVNMLHGLEWRREALPLMQQLSRTLHQFPTIDIPPEALWNLLNAAAEVKDETMAKVAVKRLVADLEPLEEDAPFIENLRRLAAQTAWNETARGYVADWWRGFIRGQPIARLARLDKVLEGKRVLEDERGILQTLTAIRKLLGGRTLKDFAHDVRAAYTILEGLAESFDPNIKRTAQFDADIMRSELDAREDQISPQERQIMANDLKEMARLIAEMGDNRTRANIMRRGDDLDRNLMKGDQAPHSAVDTMKWLSGYWGGTQEDDEENDE